MEYSVTSPEKAQLLLRRRITDQNFVHASAKASLDSNYSKLKSIICNTITEARSNSVLLLGPKGSGKSAVANLVLDDLKAEDPDIISVVRLNGLLHIDDAYALKEIARQLCLEHHLLFSKAASSDDNSQFMVDMLRECALAHKTIVFLFDGFDLFAQEKQKQRLLYSLLDAMQNLKLQAVVIGVSCRVDADQLLEKRVRSRFSHSKLFFEQSTTKEMLKLLEYLLYLPEDSTFPSKYVKDFNTRISKLLADKLFKDVIDTVVNADGTINNMLKYLFRAVSNMDMKSGLLSLENFKTAALCDQRQPKLEFLQDCSILELYMLVCMYRLGSKEHELYFNSILKEYKAIHFAYNTPDYYADALCLRAFEHLLERQLVCFSDTKGRGQSIEFRPVKLLLSPEELHQELKSYSMCPAILLNLLSHERFA